MKTLKFNDPDALEFATAIQKDLKTLRDQIHSLNISIFMLTFNSLITSVALIFLAMRH